MTRILYSYSDDAFESSVPDTADRYLVSGVSGRFTLVPWDSSPEAAHAFRQALAQDDFELRGSIGLCSDGSVVLRCREQALDLLTMEAAAAAVAQRQTSAAMRIKAESAVAWLSALVSLEDTRPERRSAHA